MTQIKSQATIETSADAMENAHLPGLSEVHVQNRGACPDKDTLPKALKESNAKKSPAQWAYERIILYIQNFEKQLDNEHEVGMGLAGGGAGVIKIEGLGYYDPDIVTYYGTNELGAKMQLIQHVTQLNVMLIANPKNIDQVEPNRIGFQLAEGLERTEPSDETT
ncbi:MAG: DUF6173 family protein [Loktanella sp.]|mgnify:FL=1|jgi:hypothetical protein|nr:DUF6173 family protein [Loktanella sp.]MDO7622772.1 DUF6173 family protein [Loktanella sp.]MDO7626359.1 DUF6173 family protein [Loktanella sp.]MDO7630406.1 DUF6173 family protein [Loktanella sp.]MDO7664612.1 DUF6173 family protein [Loktanella sp.]